MKLQPAISKTMFYSFLFAIGGSPTLAMLVIYGQNYNQDFFMTAFMSLSVLFACVLIPVVLIQNSYLLWKRKSPTLEGKVKTLSHVYLSLNIICLIFWIYLMTLST
ncbi:hypothetical protein IC789_06300 [Acinetobacter seifertii]|uniref:DUF1705 domain-containing protein n=2 Tax=Acinetobacter TaxID=469 RepID=A0A7H2U0T1_9GAMM|nr:MULTISPECIES: hypothetical protein [Acinetobacter]MBD1230792.1 hypothetical protein [Acinetobacter seifertii]ONN56158.1 membrane protein [Acinetobacter genomosp. 33YU]QNX11182.1 hypothetical protein IC794_13715 [Acinetobacter seifertii]QNX20924.1 hypothetical protein IC792_06315 [Acinetobacter seifertii]QNX27480.1 hypothetical protein IC791_06080 [Acinetobacter seifertii]